MRGRLDGDKTCDTVIVGSGIAGISTAYELAIEGQQVILIDRGPDRRRHHGAHQRPSGAAVRRSDIGDDRVAWRKHFAAILREPGCRSGPD
jgi:glycine/D-amino acid oxidase-like deaminating enzyme